MDKEDKIRACYQHCCLRYLGNSDTTNQILRDRFKIDKVDAAIVSRIIKDTLDANLIKPKDSENSSKKSLKYIPFWG